MSNINARVPPSRIAAIDSPADGEVAAYQASSGQFEWVANGSGGGGTVTSVALTETGSALTITGSPITGAGTFNIAGAGTSSQVILGDLSLATLPTGTIGGSSTANQISFGDTTANEITSSGNLQFLSGQNLYVAGQIKIGNASGTKLTTVTSQNLILDTDDGSNSGNITIVAGANGQISITPNGTGTIKLDGVELDNSAIATGYILKASSATAAGWVAESGGGISWSTPVDANIIPDTDDTYDIGALATQFRNAYFDGTVRTDNLTVDSTASVSANITLGGGSYSTPSYSFIDDPDCGMGREDTNAIFLGTGGSPRLKIYSDGAVDLVDSKLKINNSYGTDGQVLTSTGSGIAWEDAGGGGSPGGSDTQIQYNNGGAFGGSSVMTFDDTGSAEQVLFSGTSSKAIFKVEQLGAGNSIEVHDAATDTTIFLVDQYGRAAIKTNTVSSGYDLTVGGSSFIQGHLKLSTTGTTANPAIKWDGDLTTGINRPATGEIAIVASGAETFRFGADGDFEIVGDAGTAGQVFTSGGASAAASWTTPSGGGSPGGSDSQIQYNNGGAFGGSSVMTFDDTGSAEQVLISSSSSTALLKIEQTGAGNAFEVHDATAPDGNRFEIDQYGRASVQGTAGTNSASLYVGGNISTAGRMRGIAGTIASPSYSSDADTNTGIFFPAADEIGFSNGGTETFRMGADGDFEIVGDAGTSGQVFTSGGAGAAASWTTVSGGSSIWNQVNTKNNINSSYRRFVVSRLAPYGQYGTGTTTTGSVDSPHCRPFISPVSGDVTEIGINVTTADATAGTKLMIGIYSDSNGAPDSLLTTAVMNSTSTGSSFQTSFTGTATLVAGTQYWYMWVRNNSTNPIGFSAMSNTHLVWIGASSTVSAGMNQQAVLSLSGSDNSLPGTVTQSNLTPSFYGSIELGLKIA